MHIIIMVITVKKNLIHKILFYILPFLLGIGLHFLYETIPFPPFGIYAPIDESVFQHTKLTFTPLVITYLFFYLKFKNNINKDKFLSSIIISIVSSTLIMLALYYIFFSFTQKENLFLNILSLFIGIIVAQYISIYSYNKNITWSQEISIYSLITLTLLFTIFSAYPPQSEFFQEILNIRT